MRMIRDVAADREDELGPLLGVNPARDDRSGWLLARTMWEQCQRWEAMPVVYIKLYELVASPRSVAHLLPHKQRIRALPQCEEVDVWQVPISSSKPRRVLLLFVCFMCPPRGASQEPGLGTGV